MAYTNSSLVDYTRLSPNNSGLRNHEIDTIAIHCVVGQCSVEALGAIFAPTSKQASSNYGIGSDGRVGMYVEEKNRSWCTSSSAVDNRAVTIECASDATEPYAVKDVVFNKLIVLVADICKRNNITKLVWSDKKEDRINRVGGCNMMVHRDYSRKSCPGSYLYSKHQEIADKVNAILGKIDKAPDTDNKKPEVSEFVFNKGDTVKIASDAYYYNGKAKVPTWVINKEWYLAEASTTTDRCVIGKSVDGVNNIMSAISSKYLTKVVKETYTYYIVKRGDNLTKIASTYNTNISTLVKLNDIKNPNILYIGQKLKIPK